MSTARLLAALLFTLAFVGAEAEAASPRNHYNVSVGGSLDDSDLIAAPRMFQKFCRARPDQCVTHGYGEMSKLNETALAQLRNVDLHVNHMIRPLPAPATDAYQLGVKAGSCNEYAVEKRRELLAQGWPAAALSLTVVRLPDGQGHLVLTVRTDHGDLVLDNLTDRIVAVDQTEYIWVERQSKIHPMLWVRIGGVTETTVAANEPDLR